MLCCYFDILTASWLQISFKLLGRGREILLLYIKINTINYPFVKSQILRAKPLVPNNSCIRAVAGARAHLPPRRDATAAVGESFQSLMCLTVERAPYF